MTATIKIDAENKDSAIAALSVLINNIKEEKSDLKIVKSCILNDKECTIIG